MLCLGLLASLLTHTLSYTHVNYYTWKCGVSHTQTIDWTKADGWMCLTISPRPWMGWSHCGTSLAVMDDAQYTPTLLCVCVCYTHPISHMCTEEGRTNTTWINNKIIPLFALSIILECVCHKEWKCSVWSVNGSTPMCNWKELYVTWTKDPN